MLVIKQNSRRHFAGIGREFAGGDFLHPGRNIFV
jgi:hypothetical protein